ncbi:RNA polymerase sigma-70 factor [Chitinophaga sp. SYP-B3965]|uniref:RNA polymerase sigma factor n=1 Tax=Chitinophaga sp. SYP-B3965 TaxID=2663120 RepID=UPI00129980EF|nr:RNA polymerase sigma-70 factor [Chitinophaga sp. SYP-B3965]MRG43902.1 RNA polymerase sigma-70 factor [Chitinophaga sp. SYP-B3965]
MFTTANKELKLRNKVVDISEPLLQQVSEGSESAFRKLFHQYADHLHTYIWQLTKSKELSEEVVQDIFLQIWMARETLSGIRNFRTYLFVITRNHALNALKKITRERKRQDEWEQTLHMEWEAEDIEAGLSIVEEAIEQLPAQQQKAWLLSRKQGKKYQEIAEEMNLSRETVKKYIQYATQSITQYVIRHPDLLLLILLLSGL